MAKKKQIEENIEQFKNISNDKTIVESAELKKEKQQKKIQEKIKQEKEKYTSKEETITTDVNKTKDKEIKIENVDNCEPMETPVVETVEDLIQTVNNITETVEEKVETIEEKVEVKEETSEKKVYDMKRMFGYDWMGVVYDE